MKTQEHDATLEIISPHCGALQHHHSWCQYEQETRILFTTKTWNSPTNQNYFWQMNAVWKRYFCYEIALKLSQNIFITAKPILFNDPIFIAQKWLINKKSNNVSHTQYGQSQSEKKKYTSQFILFTTASKYIPKRPRICINLNPPFQTQIYLLKVPLNVNIVKQDLLHKKQFSKNLWSEVWKGGFQLMQILGLWGMLW